MRVYEARVPLLPPGEAIKPRGACPSSGLPVALPHGMNWDCPCRATAPGPGRSPAPSTIALNAGGMQKTLTSVVSCAAPSLMQAPLAEPVSLMVRAGPSAKAPLVRCLHLVKGAVVHWLSAVHALAGGPWKLGANAAPQKPQKTNGWARSTGVFDWLPVERPKGIGSVPMKALAAGGQSWLVGVVALGVPTGVHGCPAFGPAVHVLGVPVHRGHGTTPSVGPVR